ncbi:hypothetical protein D932_02471 [Enterococcus casseliflavus 14-MB-W-14]|uniref:hypothetical protein n=1 Tax=Enterococcus casseliflavus TaxID=37734 RepID=UPI0003546E4F|nr:hypothetical protein [Enterococcus casseliflavus]AMG51593.1 hypothetical protein AL523_17750 [Enterococcus gallinarum]EPH62573.1 hypothetical protein D932_02471 [Enterococcus casseliflavus 14-MB-W-14]NKD39775.1 hypothetical protein [Enterococcus casseliflavus]
MKRIEDFVKDGWEVSMQVSKNTASKKYNVFLFGHQTFNWELVGEGNTYDEMMVDLIDCEKEFMETYLLSLLFQRSVGEHGTIFTEETAA